MRIRWGKTYVTLKNSHQLMAKLSAVLPFFRSRSSGSDSTAVSQFPMQLLQELATALPPLQLPAPPITTATAAAAAAAADAVHIADVQPSIDATVDTTTDAATDSSANASTPATVSEQRKRSLSMPLPPPLTLIGANNNTSWVRAHSHSADNSSTSAIAAAATAAAAAAAGDDTAATEAVAHDGVALSNSSTTSDTATTAGTGATGSATAAATGVVDSPADTKLLGLAEHAVATAMAELFAMHGPLETPQNSSNGFNSHRDVGRALSGVEEGDTEHDVTGPTVTDPMNSTV
jgi:hypothetical protein